MGMIVRHEFLGSWTCVVLLSCTVIGIPLAFLYVLRTTVTVVEDMENPTEFLDAHIKGEIGD
jgi:hypothetical protein